MKAAQAPVQKILYLEAFLNLCLMKRILLDNFPKKLKTGFHLKDFTISIKHLKIASFSLSFYFLFLEAYPSQDKRHHGVVK